MTSNTSPPAAIPPRTSSNNYSAHASTPSSPTSPSRHRSTSGGSGEWLANRLPLPLSVEMMSSAAIPSTADTATTTTPLADPASVVAVLDPDSAVSASASASASASGAAAGTATPPSVSSPSRRPSVLSSYPSTSSHVAPTQSGTSSSSSPSSPPPLPPPPPPPDPNRYRDADLDHTHVRKTWTAAKERIVRGPFDYLNGQPGKDFRTRLIKAFDAWLQVPPDSLAIITRVVDMLHTASLLVDDVEDGSSLRRGLPVAHSIFGVPQTINSANYVYFVALRELARLPNNPARAVDIFSDELVNLHRGQGMDLFWRDSLVCPSEDDYLEMVGNKTGGLFRLGIKLMQAESPHEADFDCVPLVNIIGPLFQIRDDLMNLESDSYSTNKGLCEDLTEGKFSFPIIHSIRADPASKQLLSILGRKTTDADVKRYAVSCMRATGSFDYTRQVLAVLMERARNMVDHVDGGRGRAAGMHAILDWAAT